VRLISWRNEVEVVHQGRYNGLTGDDFDDEYLLVVALCHTRRPVRCVSRDY
jgi:hypothetical protein